MKVLAEEKNQQDLVVSGINISHTYMRTQRVSIESEYHILGYEDDPVEETVCSKFASRKNGGYPVYIMQHHTVADYSRTIDLFTANKGDEMWNWGSSHYVIREDGYIDCMVSPEYRAYHAGKGYFLSGSKLNPSGAVAVNDMNSWSIGIENVNDGYSQFTLEQMRANITLMEQLVTTYPSLNKTALIGHGDWDPSRKCDPNPYFDWELAATASKLEGIEHDFGVYPSIKFKPDSEVLISGIQPESGLPENTAHVQELLAEIGYNVFAEDKSNKGVYDLQTKNCVKAFKNHYMNTAVVDSLEDIRSYEPYDGHDPFMIEVTGNTIDILAEVADLLVS